MALPEQSLFITKVTGAANPGTTTKSLVFRFLIPTDTLLSNPITSPFYSSSSGVGTMITHPQARVVNYPCRADKIQNFLVYPANHQEREGGDWYTGCSGTREDILRVFPDAHPVLKEIFRLAPENEIMCWPLLCRAPLKTWHKQRCLLVGDAAHPMLPHQGQGGAMAFEDAEALAVVLANLEPPELERRLELFEKIRAPRVSAMQIFSSVPMEESAKVENQARPYIQGKVPPGVPVDVVSWKSKYDALDDSQAALGEYMEGELASQ